MGKSVTPIGLFYKNWVCCDGLSEFEDLVWQHQIVEKLHAGGQFKHKRDKLTLFYISDFLFEKINKSMSLKFFSCPEFLEVW